MTIASDTRGVFAIAPTPFQPDGALDRPSLDRMVDFYQAAGVDGLTILGIMGEAPKLDAPEALDVVARIVRRARLPVVVGVSAPGFAAMRSLARSAMDLGAAAPGQELLVILAAVDEIEHLLGREFDQDQLLDVGHGRNRLSAAAGGAKTAEAPNC